MGVASGLGVKVMFGVCVMARRTAVEMSIWPGPVGLKLLAATAPAIAALSAQDLGNSRNLDRPIQKMSA